MFVFEFYCIMVFVVVVILYYVIILFFNFNCVWICRYFYSVVIEERGYGLGDIWGGDVL